METIDSLIARARHHCEVHGVAWTPAQESVIRNVCSPYVMNEEAIYAIASVAYDTEDEPGKAVHVGALGEILDILVGVS